MPTFSDAFALKKTQAELDFVNVRLETDTWLSIDPFAISQRIDRFSTECHCALIGFFQRVLDSVRSGHDQHALALLSQLREPNETRLGLSARKPQGAGVGRMQAEQLYRALKESAAVRTGFLSSLEECELMIPGVSRDKISDLTTNIIRGHLVAYTQRQCDLHGVPTKSVAIPPIFSSEAMQWESRYVSLPVWRNKPILLVPKVFVRIEPAYEHQVYYRHFVLEFLRAEELDAGSALVRALKNGKRVVYKKDLEARYPCTKDFLFSFSREHPEVLRAYRQELIRLEKKGRDSVVEPEDESVIAGALSSALKSIEPGGPTATAYHRVMIGILEFVLFPALFNPRKEQEIHDGRKRIDILMENGARTGIFQRLPDIRKLPCAYVPIECRNYRTEVANPELDQLAGRFSVNRGKLGFLCCREFEDRELFIGRCRDTFQDDRGLIVPFDDRTVFRCLDLIGRGRRDALDAEFSKLIDEVWL